MNNIIHHNLEFDELCYNTFMTKLLDQIMIFFTTIGNAGMIWIALIIFLLIQKKTRKFGLLCLLALVSEYFINDMVIKNIIARERPFIANNLDILIKAPIGYSMPSGHSASSFVMAGMFLLYKQKGRFLVLFLAMIIAYSRVYLHVHYMSDILVGAFVGLSIATIISLKFQPQNLEHS